MAAAGDIRSALSLDLVPPAPNPTKKAAAPPVRKPEGISRELFSLIGPSSTTLVAQLAKPRLKQKPNLGQGTKIKWEWRAFKNGARTDSLQLHHWTKASADPEEEYQFAKYNIQPVAYTYTQDEYNRFLEDEEWTKEETDYLMNIVREYDTRWYVILDRYDYPSPTERTMEDIKDRYCAVCRKLIRNQPWAGDEASKNLLMASLNFDKDREVMRKKYVASLEGRTPEQIAEEEALYMEIKRLEQNERRFKRERDDLLRTIAGIESGLPDIVEDEAALTGILLDTKRSKRKGGGGGADPDSPATPLLGAPVRRLPTVPKNSAYDLQQCITRTDTAVSQTGGSGAVTKVAHQPAYLRSFKLPFPKASVAPKVTQALAELAISHTRLVMPTQGNVALLEGLIDAATSLVETKKVVDKVEFDIQVLKNRLGMQGPAATKVEEGDEVMEVDDGNEAEGDVDAEGEDGRAQSVVSMRSARSRKQARRSLSISSVDTSATVSTRAGTKRQRRN